MWFCPTHERPARLSQLVEGSSKTAPDSRVHILASGTGYEDIALPRHWTLEITDRITLADKLNYALKQWPDESFYGWIADDIYPLTAAWDTELAALAGHWRCAYPNDTFQRWRLATHQCIGGELMRAVGCWVPPGISHSYMDNFWHTLASRLGVLSYAPDVVWRHDHYFNERADEDSTYDIARQHLPADRTTWNSRQTQRLISNLIDKIGDIWSRYET